jgi:hypothetical protein
MTVTENAGNVALDLPITMFEYLPTSPVERVPVKRPLVALNCVHGGGFWIENATVPVAPVTAGWKP